MMRVPVPPEMLQLGLLTGRLRHGARCGAHATDLGLGSTRETADAEAAEKLAKLTHTPLGYLFLSERPDERLPVPDYRTVAGAAGARPSPDLLDTLYTMQRRQAWLRESLVENELEPLTFVASARLADDPGAVGREMRRALGLNGGWAAGVRTWQDTVGELRRAIEQLGVLAVINGVVGNIPIAS